MDGERSEKSPAVGDRVRLDAIVARVPPFPVRRGSFLNLAHFARTLDEATRLVSSPHRSAAMACSKFALADGYESRESQWIRSIFHSLMEAGGDWREDMALYITKEPAGPAVLYFSPIANRRMRAAVSRFIFTDCERPDTRSVEVVEGPPLAWMTEWQLMGKIASSPSRCPAAHDMSRTTRCFRLSPPKASTGHWGFLGD